MLIGAAAGDGKPLLPPTICWNSPDSVNRKTNGIIHVWPAQVLAPCKRRQYQLRCIYSCWLIHPRSDWASDARTNIQHYFLSALIRLITESVRVTNLGLLSKDRQVEMIGGGPLGFERYEWIDNMMFLINVAWHRLSVYDVARGESDLQRYIGSKGWEIAPLGTCSNLLKHGNSMVDLRSSTTTTCSAGGSLVDKWWLDMPDRW